jgi:hypothetical protein
VVFVSGIGASSCCKSSMVEAKKEILLCGGRLRQSRHEGEARRLRARILPAVPAWKQAA